MKQMWVSNILWFKMNKGRSIWKIIENSTFTVAIQILEKWRFHLHLYLISYPPNLFNNQSFVEPHLTLSSYIFNPHANKRVLSSMMCLSMTSSSSLFLLRQLCVLIEKEKKNLLGHEASKKLHIHSITKNRIPKGFVMK